jgi:hypothetical protein
MLVMFVAAAKIMAVKAGTLFKLAYWPFQPTLLVCAYYRHSCFVKVEVLKSNMSKAIYLF